MCVAGSTAYAGPPISAKQAEAQRISAQLQQLDASAQVANSRYLRATARLDLVQQQLAENTKALGVARANLAASQKALSQRLVAIYTSDASQSSSLAVILGATTLDNLVSRLETLNTVTKQDSSLIRQVTSYKQSIIRHRTLLHRAKQSVSRLVSERAAAKRMIEAKLSAEQRLYDSVRAQIAQLEANQRASRLAANSGPRSPVVVPPLGGGLLGGNLSGGRYGAAVGIAERYLGTPYVWGGASPSGFDCSGLVMYVYAQLGVSLPHYTVSQYEYPNAVHPARSQLEPGDLVFFAGLGHVGIYIGNNQFIHAPHTGAVVSIDSLSGWYSSEYYGATRILG